MKNAIILGFMILTFGLSILAQNDDKCVRTGWVEDTDPKGTNIRATPGLNGKIIAVVPHSADPEHDVTVEIIGYSDGWLKIKAAENVEQTFSWKGTGWISAKKVIFAIENQSGARSAPFYALPKRSSKKIGSVPDTAKFVIVGFDCFGFKVSYKGKSGWLSGDDTCGSTVTTCP
jgi:hypothetical protein